jgi:hypothetical protein
MPPFFFKFEEGKFELISFSEQGGSLGKTTLSPQIELDSIVQIEMDFALLLRDKLNEGTYSQRTNPEISFDEDSSDALGNILCIRRPGRQKPIWSPSWASHFNILAQELAKFHLWITGENDSCPTPPWADLACPFVERRIHFLNGKQCVDDLKKRINLLQKKIKNLKRTVNEQNVHLQKLKKKGSLHHNSCVMKKSSSSPTRKVVRKNDDRLIISLLEELLSRHKKEE